MSTQPHNVRIFIQDLIYACRALGEVHVVAAGSLYATLNLSDAQVLQLSREGIQWSYD